MKRRTTRDGEVCGDERNGEETRRGILVFFRL